MASTYLKKVPIMLLFLYTVAAQQAYEQKFAQDCSNTQHPDIVYGYECNGQQKACQAYAVYRSRGDYQSLANISQLLNSNLSQMATINGFSANHILAIDQPVYAPLDCSCVGNYSQANATYTVKEDDTYLIMANNTYQTLSTCQALQQQNNINATELTMGTTLTVPLRCACPTAAQADNRIRYLLSYPVISGDDVNTIGERYGATAQEIFDANEMATSDTIYVDSNLLVPLRTEPKPGPATAPPPPPPPSPPAPTPTGDGSGSKAGLYAGIAVAAAAALAVLVAAGCILYRKAKKKTPPTPPGKGKDSGAGSIPGSPWKGKGESDLLPTMADVGHVLPQYKYEDLAVATGDFGAANRITASVYRGVLAGGAAVAIKKFSSDVFQEVQILKKLNHINLVRLLGLCASEGRWYLVYEYADNGSLDEVLRVGAGVEPRSRTSSFVLSWRQRIQIALDIANGLHYLHSYANPPYVHKDIKSSNILLDGNFRVKIANFGLAKAGDTGTAEGGGGFAAMTRHVVGTKGYMAPEYLSNGLVTPKLDVFAFGVVLLQLLSGREAVAEAENRAQAAMLWSEIGPIVEGSNPKEKLRGFMDPSLSNAFPPDMALDVARLAALCVDQDLNRRPASDEIVTVFSRWICVLQLDSGDSNTGEMVGR
uniref:Protein kinase domain-containing protein n=1 Tax=Araucaria cunninghamii TaxID=56994 RepID=A0A0D6QRD8_ARACU